MTEVSGAIEASPRRVFAELSDGWAYVGWVVGSTHIRDVEEHWPQVGSKIHHKVGSWPIEVVDYTESMECEPDQRLVLRARGWPLGEARVEILLTELAPERTLVTIREAPIAGPGRWLDNRLLRSMLRLRNVETLRRLRDRAEHRAFPTSD